MSSATIARRRSRSFPRPVSFRAFASAFEDNLRDPRFWVVQAMVIGVTVSHAVAEAFSVLPGEHLGPVYFLPASLYFFPVLYASLNFGREGAVPTAVWSAVLAVPNILLWHDGLERAGEAFQLATIVALAAIVATRVDREITARRLAEEQGQALRVSELKYHSLFDTAGQAILVLDNAGMIHEANEAAAALFGRSVGQLKGGRLEDAIGKGGLQAMVAPTGAERRTGHEFLFTTSDGEVWLEPVCTRLPDSEDGLVLGLFRDVTARRGFQSYAREIVRAQEDERQRIARELHDVSLQSVVLLCRRLDSVEEAADGNLPVAASRALASSRALAEGIGAELRRFSRDLRPSVLDDLGLVPAIRSLLVDLQARSGIETRFRLTGIPLRLPANSEMCLFRISQEGLRNVERHSEAKRVTVKLAFEAESVNLAIIDNGRGFQMPQSMTSLATAGRLGLLGMEERASLAGGACKISSRPGKGTRVSVRLPATRPKFGQNEPLA